MNSFHRIVSTLIFAIILARVATPQALSPSASPTKRARLSAKEMQEILDFMLKRGREETLKQPFLGALGLGAGESLTIRRVIFKDSNGVQHRFYTVPEGGFIMAATADTNYAYVFNANQELVRAVRIYDESQTTVLSNSEAQEGADNERRLWVRIAPHLQRYAASAEKKE